MPQEPERPIEKLLRASAKRRLEEARTSFELDPGTRRRLLAEVTRKFSSPPVKHRTWTPLGLLRWPRLAWGVAAALALICGMWMIRPQSPNKKPQFLIAQNRIQTPVPATTPAGSTAKLGESMQTQRELRDKTAAVNANEPTASGAPPLTFSPDRSKDSSAVSLQSGESASALADSQIKPMEDASLTSKKVATHEAETQLSLAAEGVVRAPEIPVVAAPTSPVPVVLDTGAAAASLRGIMVTTARPNSALAGSSESTGSNRELKDRFQTIIQTQPSQSSSAGADLKTKLGRTDTLSAPLPILTSFEFAQSGRQLLVTDNDGSVYTGYFQPVAAEGVQVSARRSISPQLAEPKQTVAGTSLDVGSSGPQTYTFNVSGTNITLNQRVVFSGKLIQTILGGAEGGGVASEVWKIQSPTQSQGVTRRVSGKAMVGNKREIAIEAVSAPLEKKAN